MTRTQQTAIQEVRASQVEEHGANEPQPFLTLQLGDDESIEVPMDIACQCQYITNIVNDTDASIVPIAAACADPTSVRAVLRLCEALVRPGGTDHAQRLWEDELSPAMDSAAIFRLLRSASYLDQPETVTLLLAAAVRQLRLKTSAELRTFFALPADLTTAESRAAEAEHIFTPEPLVDSGRAIIDTALTATSGESLDEHTCFHVLSQMDESDLRLLKGSCRWLRSLSRQVLTSKDWQVRNLSAIQLFEAGAGIEAIDARLGRFTGEVEAVSFPRKHTLLAMAVLKNDEPLASTLVDKYHANVDIKFKLDSARSCPTVLEYAVVHGQVGILAALLRGRAQSEGSQYHDARYFRKAGTSDLLHCASRPQIAQLLIDAGADVNRPSSSERARLELGWALHVVSNVSPLHSAAARGLTDLARVLIDAGANVHATMAVETMDGGQQLQFTAFDIAMRKHRCAMEMVVKRTVEDHEGLSTGHRQLQLRPLPDFDSRPRPTGYLREVCEKYARVVGMLTECGAVHPPP